MFNAIKKLFKRQTASIEEYIYIDRDRISSYADQLRAPITSVAIPNYSVGLNSISPSAKVGYTGSTRTYTVYEQLRFLTQKLIEKKQLLAERWVGSQSTGGVPAFRIETCLASKITLSAPDGQLNLILWVSRFDPWSEKGKATTLILLERLRMSDADPQFMSSYSWLLALFMKSTSEILSLLVEKYPDDYKKEPDIFLKRMSLQFSKNPIGFFTDLGAQIYPERCIKCLYRIRDTCLNTVPYSYPVAVSIGYPLFIQEAPREAISASENKYVNKPISSDISQEQFERDLQTSQVIFERTGMEQSWIRDELDRYRALFKEYRHHVSSNTALSKEWINQIE